MSPRPLTRRVMDAIHWCLFDRYGGVMDEEFRKQHAKRVREIAEKAEPIMKKRLLKLASRYDGQKIRQEGQVKQPAEQSAFASREID